MGHAVHAEILDGDPTVVFGEVGGVLSKLSRVRMDVDLFLVAIVLVVVRVNALVNVYGAGARECTKRK